TRLLCKTLLPPSRPMVVPLPSTGAPATDAIFTCSESPRITRRKETRKNFRPARGVRLLPGCRLGMKLCLSLVARAVAVWRGSPQRGEQYRGNSHSPAPIPGRLQCHGNWADSLIQPGNTTVTSGVLNCAVPHKSRLPPYS